MVRKAKDKNTQSTDVISAINTTEANTTQSDVSSNMVTGYQYGDDGQFIGAYRFEKNLDKEALHFPPCTVLTPPPINLPADEEAYFDGNQWQVRKLHLAWLPALNLDEKQEGENGHGENAAAEHESAMAALSHNLSPAGGREERNEPLRDFHVNKEEPNGD